MNQPVSWKVMDPGFFRGSHANPGMAEWLEPKVMEVDGETMILQLPVG